jgi:hypothetical protein
MGDFFGARQHGLPAFRFFDPQFDDDLLVRARARARVRVCGTRWCGVTVRACACTGSANPPGSRTLSKLRTVRGKAFCHIIVARYSVQ